jgi:hypothetical protein
VVEDLTGGVLADGTGLLHDSDVTAAPGSWRTTVGALPLLAAEARRRGIAVGPLAEHALRVARHRPHTGSGGHSGHR